MFNPFDCEGCEQRREKIAEWTRGWAEWARDPMRNPRPGSKEWFRQNPNRSTLTTNNIDSGLTGLPPSTNK